MKILHIYPKSVNLVELKFHGSTKDIRCRTEYFRSLGWTLKEYRVERKEDQIIEFLKKIDLKKYRFIVIDIPSSYPNVLRYIRNESPESISIFRSHNAEFFHRIDWMCAEKTLRMKLIRLRHAFLGLYRDIRTIYYAHYVLPISDWEATNYWRLLGKPEKSVFVPYFLPTEYLIDNAREIKKDKLCVCFTAIQSTPLMADAVKNFSNHVEGLGDHCNDWKFAVVGNAANEKPPTRIHVTGVLESPFEMLQQARAVAVLSDLGRGFKTKIMEAIQARAYVLVPPPLFKRLPKEVLPFCIPVRKNSVVDFQRALDKCMEPYPEGDPNGVLRAQAYEALNRLFSKFTDEGIFKCPPK
ncbi:glycosyltransferase family 4 protein [Nitrosomonadaceae bacterium]|nr:glycosyltransferase family 4 protein [Nitrosomonadaceae bacterium]